MKSDYFEYTGDFAERLRQLETRHEQLKIEAAYDEEIEHIKKVRILQQKETVIDSRGNRWCKCRYCGKIATLREFSSYGGPGQRNTGTCYDCGETADEEMRKKFANIGKNDQTSR